MGVSPTRISVARMLPCTIVEAAMKRAQIIVRPRVSMMAGMSGKLLISTASRALDFTGCHTAHGSELKRENSKLHQTEMKIERLDETVTFACSDRRARPTTANACTSAVAQGFVRSVALSCHHESCRGEAGGQNDRAKGRAADDNNWSGL